MFRTLLFGVFLALAYLLGAVASLGVAAGAVLALGTVFEGLLPASWLAARDAFGPWAYLAILSVFPLTFLAVGCMALAHMVRLNAS